MKKKFEHERNDKGKKVVFVLSVEILRIEWVSGKKHVLLVNNYMNKT